MNHAIITLREERRALAEALSITLEMSERLALVREIEDVTRALALIGSAPEKTATVIAFVPGGYVYREPMLPGIAVNG